MEIPVASTFQLTFDCADPSAMAGFWSAVLSYEIQPPPPGPDGEPRSWPEFLAELGVPESDWNARSAIVSPDRPRIFFQRVPERKIAKNRLHFDINVAPELEGEARRKSVESEVVRVIDLGARRLSVVDTEDEYAVVMADIEGNEFCLQ